jgi:histidyl-tRNA synthetase|tara:strand:- start:339 stop:1511 length:1173 start_codon:yes stop_codon:yes gene_type:complete
MIEQVKGTRNLYGLDAQKYLYIYDIFRSSFNSYGYDLIELPTIEHKELFNKSIGENSEIVTKQMYEFKDKGNRDLVLRPEATASVVRFHNEFFKNESKKYSYFGKMFRYENPQKNRYREFIQAGAEIVGTIDKYSDLQILKTSIRFLSLLKINSKLNINTIGTKEEREEYIRELDKYFIKNKNELSKESVDKIGKNTLRILDSNDPFDNQITDLAPVIYDFLSNETLDQYETFKKELMNEGIDFTENPKLVRGLDYYNDLTFEFIANGTVVGGGGRYDGLSEILGLGKISGVGVAFGVDRLINTVNSTPHKIKVMLIAQNLSDLNFVSTKLDKAGINYLLPVRDSKENTQYKEAIKNNVDYVINCSENTIKNINNNESMKFNISNLRKLL